MQIIRTGVRNLIKKRVDIYLDEALKFIPVSKKINLHAMVNDAKMFKQIQTYEKEILSKRK